jgi:hypothetical protein
MSTHRIEEYHDPHQLREKVDGMFQILGIKWETVDLRTQPEELDAPALANLWTESWLHVAHSIHQFLDQPDRIPLGALRRQLDQGDMPKQTGNKQIGFSSPFLQRTREVGAILPGDQQFAANIREVSFAGTAMLDIAGRKPQNHAFNFDKDFVIYTKVLSDPTEDERYQYGVEYGKSSNYQNPGPHRVDEADRLFDLGEQDLHIFTGAIVDAIPRVIAHNGEARN